MITFSQKGDFKKLNSFFEKSLNMAHLGILDRFGKIGVERLEMFTPKDTGLTSRSWEYKIERSDNEVSIVWTNSNRNNGVPIALVLQYGHMTPQGYYIEGRDYINPAMEPVFNELAQKLWKEITRV